MRLVRASLLVALVAPALVVMGGTQALACSCIPHPPDRAALKDANAVFSGTMSEVEEGADIGFDRVTWTFAVDEVYKGDVAETQEVTSHTQSAACGLVFKEEKKYVVFAYMEAGGLETNSCLNTRPLADGTELKLEPIAAFEKTEGFGPGGTSDPAQDSGWDPLVIGSLAMVGLVGVMTLVVLARRRRSS